MKIFEDYYKEQKIIKPQLDSVAQGLYACESFLNDLSKSSSDQQEQIDKLTKIVATIGDNVIAIHGLIMKTSEALKGLENKMNQVLPDLN